MKIIDYPRNTVFFVITYAIFVGEKALSFVATWSFNKQKRPLLTQLRRIGEPPLVHSYGLEEVWRNVECSHHGPKCTPENCKIRQIEQFMQLALDCRFAGVSMRRIRLIAI